jgi:hypothetical protein
MKGSGGASGPATDAPTISLSAALLPRTYFGLGLAGSRRFNAHENEISERQNRVTATPREALSSASTELMRNPCEPHHGTAAADPPIAAVVKYRCFVFQVFQRARFCACIGWAMRYRTVRRSVITLNRTRQTPTRRRNAISSRASRICSPSARGTSRIARRA